MATKDESPKAPHEASPQAEHSSPKKRRKVNHACIYCRRSHMTCDLERPCQRCVKRGIYHLCHDEPRDPTGGVKPEKDRSVESEHALLKQERLLPGLLDPSFDQELAGRQFLQEREGKIPPNAAASNRPMNTSQPVPPTQDQAFGDSNKNLLGYGEWGFNGQSRFQDMPGLPPYMFNAPDITDEYNVLNEFVSSSLLDDGSIFANAVSPALDANPLISSNMTTGVNGDGAQHLPPSQQLQPAGPAQASFGEGKSISRPKSARPDKEEEKYYMKIADPSGNDTPEERMEKLLTAKYNAGMLKPFNYVQGYARLNHYMDRNLQPASRQRILRQLDKFRPKFRERMQSLTDKQLTFVEMWFEQKLMEYDRVFASMAVPACCWRRTGEIFRGNKEMAELIHVPIEKLRDGKLALHEIIAENDLVSYWDNFLGIAFDTSQKAVLTKCSLKNPDPESTDPEIKCCFSFTIRRDAQHNIPSLIVGNFLPQSPRRA